MAVSSRPAHAGAVDGPRRSLVVGLLTGLGVAGFADEVVFHQLLHWHHFYDRSTPGWALVSDGLFHAASWLAMVSGLFALADLRRRGAWHPPFQLAGFCLALGGFELYDGTIQHKWWHLHEIRYGVGLLPYDLTWNAVAVAFVAAGAVVLMRARRRAAPARA